MKLFNGKTIVEGETLEINDLSIFGDPDWLHRNESQDNMNIEFETISEKE